MLDEVSPVATVSDTCHLQCVLESVWGDRRGLQARTISRLSVSGRVGAPNAHSEQSSWGPFPGRSQGKAEGLQNFIAGSIPARSGVGFPDWPGTGLCRKAGSFRARVFLLGARSERRFAVISATSAATHAQRATRSSPGR